MIYRSKTAGRLIRSCLTLLLAALATPGLQAQTLVPGPVDSDVGPVQWPGASGITTWASLRSGALWKLKPSVSGDPLIEVLLPPGISGSPTQPERFKLQFPLNIGQIPVERRVMILGFHHFGVSEQALFGPNTNLAQICRQKGWLLLAPYGLDDRNMANEPSQKACEAVLDFVDQYFDWNQERIYAVGFSMGGLNALSFGLRHQDPAGRRIAGIISHMGTVDPIYAYDTGSPLVKTVLESPTVFGGSPTAVPYNYRRVTAGLMTSGGILDTQFAPSINLLDTRVFLSININDPETLLQTQMDALANYLASQGLDVQVYKFSGMALHSWATLDEDKGLAFLEGGVAPGAAPSLGPPIELYADRPAAYRFTEVRDLPAQSVARYKISLGNAGTNSFGVLGTRLLDRLALDLSKIGLQTNQTLTFTTWSTDGSAPTFVIKDFPQSPSSILVNGLAPAAWSYAAAIKELSIQPTTAGQFATVVIQP